VDTPAFYTRYYTTQLFSGHLVITLALTQCNHDHTPRVRGLHEQWVFAGYAALFLGGAFSRSRCHGEVARKKTPEFCKEGQFSLFPE